MLKRLIFSIAFLLFFSADVFALANLSLFYGGRYFTSSGLSPADSVLLKGARLDLGAKGWPFNIAADFYMSDYNEFHYLDGEHTEVTESTKDIRLGIRRYFGKTMRFFVGAGVSNVIYKERVSSVSINYKCKESTGFNLKGKSLWYEAGADYQLGTNFTLGVAGGFSHGKVKCEGRAAGEEVRLDGVNAGITLGAAF